MKNQFSCKLTELLKENSLSKRALAEKIGVSAMSVSDWSNGNVQPTAENIFLLADFFDVSADYLLGRADDFGNVAVQSGGLTLTEREKDMIKQMRLLPESTREMIFRVLDNAVIAAKNKNA